MPSRREDLPVVARRLKAARMLLGGASIQEVARAHQLTPATVRKYKLLVEAGGLDALAAISVGGSISALDPDALDWIAQALGGSAMEQGFPSEAWTNARLRELIARRFGVHYSRVYAWQLATRLGLGHRLSKLRK